MDSVLDVRVNAIAVSVRDLTLVRGGAPIVEDLSFDLEPGDALVLRGPNGSGKTTLLRALAGLMKPAAGTVRFMRESDRFDGGQAFARRAAPEDTLAYLGHSEGIAPNETPLQHVRFHARWFRGDTAYLSALAAMGAAPFARTPARRLSAGQKRRAALARIVASDKPLWLLDEPAAPLDTDGRVLLDDVIARRRKAGGIIIAAAHDTLGWTNTKTLQFTRVMPGLDLPPEEPPAAPSEPEPPTPSSSDDQPTPETANGGAATQ